MERISTLLEYITVYVAMRCPSLQEDAEIQCVPLTELLVIEVEEDVQL